jgi:radical SAM protein with 4Fe4S-binding SPASM domain
MKAKLKSKLNLEERTALQDVIPLETPFLLYVDPSSACNFRCQFCPTGHHHLVKRSGYRRTIMDIALFRKLIADLGAFGHPIKVLRMNKVGEPMLNENLPKMIALAKKSGCIETIDLTTNGSLFTEDSLSRLVKAGVDRVNISMEGLSRAQYRQYARVDMDYDRLVHHIQWLFANKGDCEITIKIPGNYLSDSEKKKFLDTFGDYCDRIFIEDIAPIWPSFELDLHTNIKINTEKGQYKQQLEQKDICTFIFYAMAINADGTVSACCPDWEQKLIIGDLRKTPLKRIWGSQRLQTLRITHLEGRRCENAVCRNCGHLAYAQIDNIDQYAQTLRRKFSLCVERESV